MEGRILKWKKPQVKNPMVNTNSQPWKRQQRKKNIETDRREVQKQLNEKYY